MANHWGKTEESLERLLRSDKGKYVKEVDGIYYYMERPLIGRDTPIDGGVYVGAGEREAIVVDSSTQPLIRELYSSLKDSAMDWKKAMKKEWGEGIGYDDFESFVLKSVYDFVTAQFIYGYKREDEKLVKMLQAGDDKKVSLELFLKARAGSCRHRALAAGVLLEMFQKDGLLTGDVSIDRCLSDEGSGHGWCRYTTLGGEVYILDATGDPGYFGLLKDVPKWAWDYRRPEELVSK